jgi:hemolysin activation/secretion protein
MPLRLNTNPLHRLVPAILLALAAATARADDSFDILEYAVEGNTVLAVVRIEDAVYPHLGEKKTLQDVEAARTALEQAYHDGGYLTVFVDIPEQEVAGGAVRLRVTEGRVERLRVSGSRYYSLSHIKEKTPELAEGAVPYFPEVQKQLASVNRAADRRVTPVLRPGRSPGKVEVDLKVDDKPPLHGEVELNDRYSANTSRARLSASLRYDNLWQREHGLSLSFQTAPQDPDESRVFSLSYVAPLDSGNYLAAYAVASESDVGAIGETNVIGNGRILGLRYILPLRGRPGWSHTLTLGADYKDFDESVGLQGADRINTPISYLPFMLGYEGTLQGEGSSTQIGATLNFSVRGLADEDILCTTSPPSTANEFACKRFLGRPNYAYLRLDVKHSRALAAGWSLFGRLAGQFASGPLISNEQFAVGGADSVRGYLESNSLGDDGLLAGVELRTPDLAPRLGEGLGRLGELTGLFFVEGATLRVRDTALLVPRPEYRFDLLSAGLGLRLAGKGGLSGGLDLAWPFEDAGQTQAGDGRLHARLSYAF